MSEKAPQKLRIARLTAQNYAKLMYDFCEAHGPDQIRASYGWTSGETQVLCRNERVYAFGYDEVIVGWGGIILNTTEVTNDEASLTVGVFPAHQRQGYRTQILEWLCQKAAALGADVASMIVRKENEAHYRRTMREAHTAGSLWLYAGDFWLPRPGYGYFVRPLNDGARVLYGDQTASEEGAA